MKIDDWIKESENEKYKNRKKKSSIIESLYYKIPEFKINYKFLVALIVAAIIIFFAGRFMKYDMKAIHLMSLIEQREYAVSLDYYENVETRFSVSEMSKFNECLASKFEKFITESGESFIEGGTSKDLISGYINIINAMGKVEIKGDRIKSLCQKTSDMYNKSEIEYDTAISLVDMMSYINGMSAKVETYRQNIEFISNSREMYESAVGKQEKYQYHQAIEDYDKVIKDDEKCYKSAQKKKDECIEKMYDYYIEQAKSFSNDGDYESALEYVEYVKKYYPDDEKVNELVKTYSEKVSVYTLKTSDIKEIYSDVSGVESKDIEVSMLPQMYNGKKYYYAEVMKNKKVIDEILVNPEDKKVYSYKGENRSYNIDYTEDYFRVNTDGNIEFSINKTDAEKVLKDKFEKKKINYKNIKEIDTSKAEHYTGSEKSISEMTSSSEETYYYFLCDNGFFSKKELYCVNMYNSQVYIFQNNKISQY
ncbi:hypothetical protein EXD82_01030 [Peptacetobacter hominis]|uniref:UbiD family decarboxylase n=1 Tax=Peptacetobacter hominis TaxID=2743610 RepID=A0A544QYU5_9FIRM|nr:hypothetical protein [Peptacetobacter hominis]TQQ85828.1 hypothetical protein EXD82_01030 [Peptacetobacter hominis]